MAIRGRVVIPNLGAVGATFEADTIEQVWEELKEFGEIRGRTTEGPEAGSKVLFIRCPGMCVQEVGNVGTVLPVSSKLIRPGH